MEQWYENVEDDFRRIMEVERSDLELGWWSYEFLKIKYKAGLWN
jgi:hypothetical protein